MMTFVTGKKGITTLTVALVGLAAFAAADGPPSRLAVDTAPSNAQTDVSQTATAPQTALAINAPILDADASMLGFQAALTDNLGDPLPGPTVDLVFNLYEVGGIASLEMVAMPAVPMIGGIVNTQIAFDPNNFDGTGRELGVSVDGGAELTPRIALSASPYAFRVNRVENEELTDHVELGDATTDGSLTVFATQSGSRAIHLDGSISRLSMFDLVGGDELVRLSARTFGTIDLWDGAGQNTAEMTAGSSGARLTLRNSTDDTTIVLNAETANVASQSIIEVLDDVPSGDPLIRMSGHGWGGWLNAWDENGELSLRLGSANSSGGFLMAQTGIGGTGVLIDGDDAGDAGGLIALQRISGQNVFRTITLDADQGDGAAYVKLSDGTQQRIILDADGSGGGAGFNMYNSQTVETVRIDADDDDAGTLAMFDGTGTGTVFVDADDGTGARLSLGNSASDETIQLNADDGNGARIAIRNNASTDTITLNADDGDTGARLTLFDGTQETIRLDGKGGGGGGGILLKNSVGTVTIELDADETDDPAIRLRDTAGSPRIVMKATEQVGQGASMFLYNAAGDATIELDAEFNGNGRVITQELQITGGADLSEQFDIGDDTNDIAPGTVVCIDPKRPGKLNICPSAYDRKIAGIVSGAGGVRTGMLMGQVGTSADGKYPVALTGRVFVRADISNGTIEPGDLLTSSTKLGHAMKVTDHQKAQGAILGKAMTAIDKETGLVLVLVSLQ